MGLSSILRLPRIVFRDLVVFVVGLEAFQFSLQLVVFGSFDRQILS